MVRFDRVDGTIVFLQKDAGSIRFFDQGETGAIEAKLGVLLDKNGFRNLKVSCDCLDFLGIHRHFARPATAVGAALADVVDLVFGP